MLAEARRRLNLGLHVPRMPNWFTRQRQERPALEEELAPRQGTLGETAPLLANADRN